MPSNSCAFAVGNAIANLRLDGIEPDAYLLALTDAIAEGWITVEQAIEILDDFYLKQRSQ